MSRKEVRKLKIGVHQLVPISSVLNTNNNTDNNINTNTNTNTNTNNSVAKFKEVGYVKYGKSFDDELIPIGPEFFSEISGFKIDNNRVSYSDENDSQEVYFQFYKTNVTSTYASKTTRIPFFHCAVMYQKKLILGNLFNINLYFDILEAKKIKSYNELFKAPLKGTYKLYAEFNDKLEELAFDVFESYEKTIITILEMLSSDVIKNIINFELEKKTAERIQRYGKIDDYELPDPNKVINFDELLKKYEDNGGDMDDIMKKFS